MKSLIWKEARQELVQLTVALVFSTAVWFGAANVWDQLVRGVSENLLLFVTLPLAYAFVLAQVQFGRDGDTRRFGLLLHRRQGARGYFASKVIVGVGALACVIVLPMTLWALAMSRLDPDAALIRWVRVPQSFLFCVPALLVYAMGVLSTQLRRGALVRWGVAICGVFGAFLLVFPLAVLLEPGREWLFVWIGSDLLLAGAVLWLARSLLLAGRDRDLPLRDRQLVGFALVVFLVLLPLASFVLGSAESSALNVVVENKPAVLCDPQSGELLLATQTEDGWAQLGGSKRFTVEWSDQFLDENQQVLDVVHHAGSSRVEGADEAREALNARSGTRLISDPAPRVRRSDVMMVAVRASGESPPGEHWTVQFELDAQDGAVHIDASRAAAGLPPMQVQVTRPGGGFSTQAFFLESRAHAPIVLDCADGTLWRIELQENGALVVPLELPGGDRVSALEPLFQRKRATLGHFEQHYGSSEQTCTGEYFVGRAGSYTLLDGRVVPFDETSQPKDAVTYEEARKLVRYSVDSSWPDAFTERIRVERLADHEILFELTAEPNTRGARIAATVYCALAFLRAPASIIEECFRGRKLTAGRMSPPYPTERQLFAQGGHPLLFALLMLWGAFQLFIGWRGLALAGVGLPTRVVYMLLILAGGVVALLFTRLLLPRGVRTTRTNEAVSWTGDSPRPLHASSSRS